MIPIYKLLGTLSAFTLSLCSLYLGTATFLLYKCNPCGLLPAITVGFCRLQRSAVALDPAS